MATPEPTPPTDADPDAGRRFGRYGQCTATNRHGERCGQHAMGEHGKCYFHGGASTGPDDPTTDHLEDNDHAAGNPGGGAPQLNTNAQIHGAFGDWHKVESRLEGREKAWVDRLTESFLDVADVTATHLPPARRRELCREKAVVYLMEMRATADWFERGMSIVEEIEYTSADGETTTFDRHKANPSIRQGSLLASRQLAISEELDIFNHTARQLHRVLNGPLHDD